MTDDTTLTEQLSWDGSAIVTYLINRPTAADRARPVWPGESVVIDNFWRKPVVFHRRWGSGVICDTQNTAYRTACGHALPAHLAEKIARPCRRCFTDA